MRLKNHFLTILFGVLIGVGGFWFSHERGGGMNTDQIPPPLAPIQAAQAQAFLLPVSQTTYDPIRDFNIENPIIHARAAILADLRSHRVLYALNPDQQLPIASITKLMSAMIILDHMDINEVYTVSPEDLNVDGTGADLKPGERLRGTELFKIMMMKSSNDATSVFVTTAQQEGLDFVALMNQRAHELGMLNTHFADPQGLNDTETYSTASDVVKLIQAALRYPFLMETLTRTEIDVPTLEDTTYHIVNTDQLLKTISGILIGKTGNTTGALGTMALAVQVNTQGDGLVSVILGSQDRFGETTTLIDWGQRAHKWQQR